MNIINNIINQLKKSYKAFVSERHLQVAFAILLGNIKNCKALPEFVFSDMPNEHIDLIAKIGNKIIAFEFKYVTKKIKCKINNMDVSLKEHGAIDQRRYDCLKDIERLEELKKKKKINEGYFLLITNDSSFWTQTNTKKIPNDYDFRFPTQITTGIKKWQKVVDKSRKDPITIGNTYNFVFQNYSSFPSKNGNFKYLLLNV